MKNFLYIFLLFMFSTTIAYSQTQSYAYFSGGCFWCTEADIEKIPGINSVESGYLGGKEISPKYDQVASGRTSHREGVKISFNPSKVSYEELLEAYIRKIDPTDATGSFVDRGFQYTAAVFYVDKAQQQSVENLLSIVQGLPPFKNKKLAVAVLPFTTFYPAEDYHQDYYKKSALKYSFYRFNSGRDQETTRLWKNISSPLISSSPSGNLTSSAISVKTQNVAKTEKTMKSFANFKKPSKAELKAKLSFIAYKVTQEDATERPFSEGNFNTEKRRGIYVDIVSGEPLFSSSDKYDSKTGWPSFTKPINQEFIVEKDDFLLWQKRIELRSRYGDSHLGHVFDDGPAPTGLRYCINGAALRFIPYEDLDKEGYSDFKKSVL